MAIEKRKALVHVVFTFDCDTVGPERLKRAGVASYAVGMWDSERPDPRPRDGVNAPADLKPQMGFWAEGVQPQLTHEELTLGDGLPVDLADTLNAAALRKVSDQEALIAGMRQEGLALIGQLQARDKTVQEQAATIASLQQQLAEREQSAATIEERVAALEAAAGAKAA